MHFIATTYSSLVRRYGKTTVILALVLIAVIVIMLISRMGSDSVAVEESPAATGVRAVSLYAISAGDDGTAVRTADGNAFIVRAESGGRVERIAKVGDFVARGAVVAQVENSAERAAVLQAQGTYEAALAQANQSAISTESAERAYEETLVQARNTFKSAFATADGVLRNTVDQVFSNPDSNTIGLRINGGGKTLGINNERRELEGRFDTWRSYVQGDSGAEVPELLSAAEDNATRLNSLVVTLANLLSDDDAHSNAETLALLRSDFAQARTAMTGVLASLSGARSSLDAAKSARDQAQIGSQSGEVSLADAQVKQALGVLESARAALGKTSVKTPVPGTVTAVSISVGDIISIGSDVVFIASDAQVETKDTVTVPLTAVKFTPSKAYVFTVEEGKLVAHEVQTGSVTTKNIVISRVEGVDDIVLDVRGLKEGDTVSYKVES